MKSLNNISIFVSLCLTFGIAQLSHAKPECPPLFTGVLSHPSEDTKYLQCVAGGTFIMNCKLGAVFNSTTNRCDLHENVEGLGKGGAARDEDSQVDIATGGQCVGNNWNPVIVMLNSGQNSYDVGGTDRIRRDNMAQCLFEFFDCGENLYLPNVLRCDGKLNCPNDSDEDNCPKCPSDFFHCGDEFYLPKERHCDGTKDCADGSDEDNCSECSSKFFDCGDKTYIREEGRCNGIWDCVDGFDEENCPTCSSEYFHCGDNKYILQERQCDNTRDCANGYDEINCSNCTSKFFDCGDNRYILAEGRCDGIKDCLNGFDEENCPKCLSAFFYCGDNLYVPKQRRCDGTQDCVNGSDESNCDDGRPSNLTESKSNSPATTTEGFPEDLTCGKSDFFEKNQNANSMKGGIAVQGAYPWQASIRQGKSYNESIHVCGAVIISKSHVLTAGHCLFGQNEKHVFVRAGDYNTMLFEGTEVAAEVENYIIHEEYDNEYSDSRQGNYETLRPSNDIALVLLKGQGFTFGRYIKPICLPPADTLYPSNLICTITGWGMVSNDPNGNRAVTVKYGITDVLKYGSVSLLSQIACEDHYKLMLNDGMVCAAYLKGGMDTCKGDGGGPLVHQRDGVFTLYGLTSSGESCANDTTPGVYVRVAHYRPWIDEMLKRTFHPSA